MNDKLLEMADSIVAHGPNTTYPSRSSAQHIRRVVRDLADALRAVAPCDPSVTNGIGRWLSAALEDPQVCEEMKVDIRAWFDAGEPKPPNNRKTED